MPIFRTLSSGILRTTAASLNDKPKIGENFLVLIYTIYNSICLLTLFAREPVSLSGFLDDVSLGLL